MARYRIEVSATAEKQLGKLPRHDQVRIARAISLLAETPRPRGCRKLTGYEDIFRIRVGTCRVIYSVEQAEILIIILKIGRRKDIYR